VSGYISDPAYKTIHKNFETGAIYCRDVTEGAHAVYGAIYAKFKTLTNYSYPISDESNAYDRNGRATRYSLFSESSAIYWTQATGAVTIYGGIFKNWKELGGATSYLGFPVTDELPSGTHGARYNDFNGGMIYWRVGTSGRQGQTYAVNSVPTSLNFNVNTIDLGVLRGSSSITIANNGNIRWSSNLHDGSATVTSDWSIAWILLSADGVALELSQHGTLGPNDDADVDRALNTAEISANWRG
jgi:hypothetical protein